MNVIFLISRNTILIAALFFVCRAEGRVYFVTNTNDTTQINCLRGAIIDANYNGGENTIILCKSPNQGLGNLKYKLVFRLTIAGADEENAWTGDLDITRGNLTILGACSSVTIDATVLGDRVFQVYSNAHLSLSHLTITGGAAPQAQPGSFYASTLGPGCGGAIFNAGVLTLNDCIITNNSSGGGNSSPGNGGGIGGGDGGGIYNSGTLLATNCCIEGNSSGAGVDGVQGGDGGGIRNVGVCFLSHCIISGNQTGAGGGPEGNAWGGGGNGGDGAGIFNSGTMVIKNCIISENFCGQGVNGGYPGIGTVFSPGGWGGNGGSGAGIYNVGTIKMDFSTVHGNDTGKGGNGGSAGAGGNAAAGGNGAGIYNAGNLSLNISTISGNLCGNGGVGGDGFFNGAVGGNGGGGGAIYNDGFLNVTSCTIALNQTGGGGNGGNSHYNSSASSGGQGGDGGGILNGANSTNVLVRNTLIAKNLINIGGAGGTNFAYEIIPGQQHAQIIGDSGGNGLGFDVAGDFITQGFNLIGMVDGSIGFTNAVQADQVGSNASPIDPLLGPLQMNGGFTPTHALLWGSRAIDKGNCFRNNTDQRGYCRPYNFSSLPNAPGGDGSDIGAFELNAQMVRYGK